MHGSPRVEAHEVEITIEPFRDAYAAAFDRLNRAWLERFVRVEPLDEVYLHDPRGKIVDVGGEVFCAVRGRHVVGTCAAIPAGPATFELAKLAVEPNARGRGLGRKLAQRVVEFARERGARRVTLSSNSQLVEAIALYASMGFRHVPVPPDLGYETADICMELTL